MEIANYSAEPIGKLYGWLPYDLKAEKVIFFPDASPGKSPLPTGTVVFTKQENWRKFAVSDCGCGMLLAKSSVKIDDFNTEFWDKMSDMTHSIAHYGRQLYSGNGQVYVVHIVLFIIVSYFIIIGG